MSKGIVKSSVQIRTKLKERIKELNLSITEISKDAKSLGQNISIQSLSKYLSNSELNNLSEENIIWLAFRYGLYITLHVGQLKINERGFVTTYIQPYDEAKCLTVLKKIFPDAVKKKRK